MSDEETDRDKRYYVGQSRVLAFRNQRAALINQNRIDKQFRSRAGRGAMRSPVLRQVGGLRRLAQYLGTSELLRRSFRSAKGGRKARETVSLTSIAWRLIGGGEEAQCGAGGEETGREVRGREGRKGQAKED